MFYKGDIGRTILPVLPNLDFLLGSDKSREELSLKKSQ